MNKTLFWVIVLVVVLIMGPFATLRAVSRYRQRSNGRAPPAPKQTPDDEDDEKPSGFW